MIGTRQAKGHSGVCSDILILLLYLLQATLMLLLLGWCR
jgi:hypothetical protein